MDFFNVILIGLIFLSLLVIIVILGRNLKKIKEAKKQEVKGIDSGIAKKSIGKNISDFFVSIIGWISGFFKKSVNKVKSRTLNKKKEDKAVSEEFEQAELSMEPRREQFPNQARVGFEDKNESARDLRDLDGPQVAVDEKSKFSFMADEEEEFSKKEWKLNNKKKEGFTQEKNEGKSDELVEKFFSEKEQMTQPIGEPNLQKRDDLSREQKGVEINEVVAEKFQQSKIVQEPRQDSRIIQEELREEQFVQQEDLKEKSKEISQLENLTEMIQEEEALQDESEGFMKKFFGKFKRKGSDFSGDESGGDFNEDGSQEGRLIKEVVERKKPEGMDVDEELGVDRRMLEERILKKIASDPKNIEYYRQLGELYIKMRNFDDAKRTYRYVLQLDPRDSDAARKIEKVGLLERFSK